MKPAPAIINIEEHIGKTVGRRRPPDAMSGGMALQRTLNQMLSSTGHRLAPKGVFRFKTHEEADAWKLRMMKPSKES